MILPRSMAVVGGLPVCSLNPQVYVETLLLATQERSTDAALFQMVVSLNDSFAGDRLLDAEVSKATMS